VLYTKGFGFSDKKARLYVPGDGNTFRKAVVQDTIENYFNRKKAEIGLK
jgi:hypothetical protein